MITSIHPVVSLSGRRFSPQEAEEKTNLEFTYKREIGEPHPLDKLAHKIKLQRVCEPREPHGSAKFSVPDDVEMDKIGYGQLKWILDMLTLHFNTLQGCGVEEIEISLYIHCRKSNRWYSGFFIDLPELQTLTRLNIPLQLELLVEDEEDADEEGQD